MKHWNYNGIDYEMEMTGYGHFKLNGHTTTDTEIWDWATDDTDPDKHRDALDAAERFLRWHGNPELHTLHIAMTNTILQLNDLIETIDEAGIDDKLSRKVVDYACAAFNAISEAKHEIETIINKQL